VTAAAVAAATSSETEEGEFSRKKQKEAFFKSCSNGQSWLCFIFCKDFILITGNCGLFE